MNLKHEFISKTRSFIVRNMKIAFANINFHDSKNPLSFTSGQSMFNDYFDYTERMVSEYEAGKFLVNLIDGSFFQLSITFTGKRSQRIEKISIAYLPKIENQKWINDYIRYDYTSEGSSFFHSDSHIHIGLESDLRIPVNKLLDFEEFCSIVFFLYYPDFFIKIYNNGEVIKSKFDTETFLSHKLNHFIYFEAKKIEYSKLKT